MQTFKALRNNRFIKVDKDVMSNRALSHGAKMLYVTLCGLPQGKSASNKYLSTSMGVSERNISRYRAELINLGLVHLKRISKTEVQCYVGHTGLNAREVMNRFQNNELHPEKEQSE